VFNADALFRRLDLPRHSEVDSEVVFQLADKSVEENGRMNVRALANWISQCRGSVAAVMVAKTDPTRVVLVKGPNLLELAYSERYRAILYASEMRYIKNAQGDNKGWKYTQIQDDALVSINTNTLKIAKVVSVRWERHGRWQRYTGRRDTLGGTNIYHV
jgi:glucosamine 6-phosphate synthetase-like amidotransferase/phosphosugar isomerase protein